MSPRRPLLTRFPLPTSKLFPAHSPDKCTDSKDMQAERVHTPQSDRTRAHKRRLGSLAESRSPACRWRPSPSSPQIGRWFLDFPSPELLRACAGLHPSHLIAARGMHFPNLLSIGCCQPCAAPRLDTLRVPECSGPTAALPQHPPALSPANPYCCPSTVEAGLLPTGKSKRRAFAPGAGPDITRSARRENPTPAVRV